MKRGGKKGEAMKNYFAVLKLSEVFKLAEAKLPYYEMEVDEEKGTVVDQEILPQVLSLLGTEVIGEARTSYEGIYKLSLRMIGEAITATPRFSVNVASWNGNSQGAFMSVLSEFLPALGKNAVLHVPHNKFQKPFSDEKFHVLLWSSPRNTDDRMHTPSEMFGINVNCRDGSFSPSEKGVSIVDETGWPVAELLGENLYIHHDICNDGTDNEIKIFRRILEEMIATKTMSPEEKAKRQAKVEEERQKRSRDLYINECSARLEKTLQGTRETIANGDSKIREYSETLTKVIREVNGARRKLEQLTSCSGGELEKYGREYDKLLTLPKVKSIEVLSGVIKVFTETLYCIDPRTNNLHDIGAFRIEIFTNGANNGVKWINLTRQVIAYDGKKMHAPHIFPEGKACFGNTAEIFPDLIANYEFAAVAMVAIQFIETVNIDDSAGKYVDRWPLAPIEIQSEIARVEIERLEALRGKNPFRNIESNLEFITRGKTMDPGTIITNCGGECICWGGDRAKTTFAELAEALGVKVTQVKKILTKYFVIGG